MIFNISNKTLICFIVFLIFLISISSASTKGLYEVALEKYLEGRFHEVIEILSGKSPKNAGDYNMLGWAFLKTKDLINAIQNFQLSISLNPNINDSYCGLGYAYLHQESYNEAVENFQKYLSQDRKNVDCLIGLGLTFERLNETQQAVEIFQEILTLDKQNSLAQQKIEVLSIKERNYSSSRGHKFFAKGNYFWVKQDTGEIDPIFIKGVNMSFAVPGKFPSEFPEDEKTYSDWFTLIGEMNANLVRVYTILPPQFYSAFKKYNKSRKDGEKLYLIQGIWAELPEKSDFRTEGYLNEIKQEIRNAVDVIHGDTKIPHRYGHAHGIYKTDISEYVIAFIFGREWEPPEVIAFNKIDSKNNFIGRYLSIADANAMEVWLTEMLDYLIGYEFEKYKIQRPVAFMNWPPLDPLYHPTEATFQEQVVFRKKTGEIFGTIDYTKTFDEDAVSLDETKIVTNTEFRAGIFSSYHVYPYYPEFLRYEENYSKVSFPEGSNYYYNYLLELKNHYRDIPLLISEFGVPTSRGIARYHPEGLNHGGHNENFQADILKKLILSIKQSNCAGGIVFAWIDEWAKKSWIVKGAEEEDHLWFNAQDPEESYGLIAMTPVVKEKLTGRPSTWEGSKLLYSKEDNLPLKSLDDGFDAARNLRSINADYDQGYLYLRLDIGGAIDWENVAYLIGIDTFGIEEGDHKLPFNLNIDCPIGLEYVILLHGKNSKILIDDEYNKTAFDKTLLRFPGLTGYKENPNFRPINNKNGSFSEILTIHPRRFSRDGKVFPEKIYNASDLKEGNIEEESLSDFYYSKENNFIEIRIPWALLNFSDPSHFQIIYSAKERKITNGIRIMVVSYKPLNINESIATDLGDKINITDIIPQNLNDMKYYIWKGWNTTEYIQRPKKSYLILKEVYRLLKNPELKINLPRGFDFIPVIKEHYDSLEKFEQLYFITIHNPNENNPYGLVKNNPFYILEAKSLFITAYKLLTHSKEKEISLLGIRYTENILSGDFTSNTNTEDTFELIKIKKKKPSKNNIRKITIGKSTIKINKDTKIKTQVDRVTRDWLMAYNIISVPWDVTKDKIIQWHEGEKIKEIMDLTAANVFTVWGTKVKKFEDTWYAPDDKGIYRFALSEDKVYNYPTNLIIDDKTVIINDTHGINAIAWDSIESNLVIGCGDFESKVEAAYYLANNGVNIYMPTDRFVYKLIGTQTDGIIIGSAPIKKTEDGVIIGGQPITIDLNETVVVSSAANGYPLQYYDTPYNYFKELERYIGKPINIIDVDVKEYGKGTVVVDMARKIGANLIGIRVWGKEEHDAVYSWLKEDISHRAILFHSAVYPDGYRLFFEFPEQTSFGDINIDYVN